MMEIPEIFKDKQDKKEDFEGEHYLDAIEVVNSKNGGALVFITQKGKSFTLPCLLVSHQVDVDNLLKQQFISNLFSENDSIGHLI